MASRSCHYSNFLLQSALKNSKLRKHIFRIFHGEVYHFIRLHSTSCCSLTHAASLPFIFFAITNYFDYLMTCPLDMLQRDAISTIFVLCYSNIELRVTRYLAQHVCTRTQCGKRDKQKTKFSPTPEDVVLELLIT